MSRPNQVVRLKRQLETAKQLLHEKNIIIELLRKSNISLMNETENILKTSFVNIRKIAGFPPCEKELCSPELIERAETIKNRNKDAQKVKPWFCGFCKVWNESEECKCGANIRIGLTKDAQKVLDKLSEGQYQGFLDRAMAPLPNREVVHNPPSEIPPPPPGLLTSPFTSDRGPNEVDRATPAMKSIKGNSCAVMGCWNKPYATWLGVMLCQYHEDHLEIKRSKKA